MGCTLTTEEVAHIDRTIADLEQECAKLREEVHYLKKGDVLHVLTDQEFAEQQKHEREMQASIKALDDENARLRSCMSDAAENARLIMGENAKLREERDTYRDLVGLMDHPDLNVQLQAENDKLRELVADMWRFTGAACKKYPRLFDPVCAGGQMVSLNMLVGFEQRMAELGIEVDV